MLHSPQILLPPRRGIVAAGGASPFTLKANAAAAAPSSPTTSAIDTTGANLLVVTVVQFDHVSNPGILSDSKSNTWTPLTAQTTPGNDYCQMFYCAAPTVGSGHTFVYTQSGIFGGIAVQAWSGANVTPFDVQNGATTSTGTSLATGSVTPSANNSLIVSGFCNDGGSTYTIDSGFTKTAAIDFAGGNNVGIGMSYLLQGTAAGINPTWSWVTSSPAAAAIAVFKS